MWYDLENSEGCESLPSSPEQGGGYSAARCSAGAPSVPSRSRSIRGTSSCYGSATESSTPSRSGTMSAPSTVDHGAERSMSSAADSPARTSAAPEADSASSEESGADCGESTRVSFARFDRATASWRTHQCSLFGGLELFSATWPRSGMMRRGKCYPLATAAHRTNERGCGSSQKIPTPRANDAIDITINQKILLASSYDSQRNGLTAFVTKWPTPVASDYKSVKGSLRVKLSYAIERGATKTRKFPTPCSTDAPKWNNMTPEQRQKKAQAVRLFNVVNEDGERNGGRLNPDWVEWLMGWPIGWTALRPLATDRFRSWLRGRFAN